MKYQIFYGDRVVWIIYALLVLISIVEVSSASTYLSLKAGGYMGPIGKHIALLAVGAVITWFFHHWRCRYFRLFPLFLVPTVILMLIYVLVAGKTINSGARWIDVFGFSFQPSELAKGVMVMATALAISVTANEKGISMGSFKFIVGLALVLCGLIFSQNLSSAIFIYTVMLIMLFLARTRKKWMTWLIICTIAAGGCVLIGLKALPSDPHHWVNETVPRLATWRGRIFKEESARPADPREFEIHDKNRQSVDAHIAIARGKGIGLLPGGSVQRYYLAEAYSDFIFAIILEETGLWGGAAVIFLYLLLLYRTGRIASRCEAHFTAHLVMGFGILIVLQAILNMAVAVGLGPVTGQNLPMISKGGSSIVFTSFYFGVILSISRVAKRKDKKPLRSISYESDETIKELAGE